MRVFGVNRNLDIPDSRAPTPGELVTLEEPFESMCCEHGWFQSVADDHAELHYRKFMPQSSVRGVVIYMHGIMTHSGKAFVLPDGKNVNMALLASTLLAANYAVFAYDLYGHGYSEGKRFLIPNTWENNKEDLLNFCQLVVAQVPNKPLFLMGESYGCTLCLHVAHYLQTQKAPAAVATALDSLILTAPAILGDLPPQPVYCLLRYVLAPAFPEWRPFFMPNPVSADRIWRDPVVRKKYESKMIRKIDGSGIPFRLGTALNLVKALEAVRTEVIPRMTTPYCVIHGTQDHGVPMAGSEYLYQTAPVQDKELHLIDGAYHDLLSDPESDRVMQHIMEWLQRRS